MTNKKDKTYVGIITVTCTAPKGCLPRKQIFQVGYVSDTDTPESREEAVQLQIMQFKKVLNQKMPNIPMTITAELEIIEVLYLYVPQNTKANVFDK